MPTFPRGQIQLQCSEVISESRCRLEPHWSWLTGALTLLISLKSVPHKTCTWRKDIEREMREINGGKENISVQDVQWAQKGEPLGIDASRRLVQKLSWLAVAFPGGLHYHILSPGSLAHAQRAVGQRVRLPEPTGFHVKTTTGVCFTSFFKTILWGLNFDL